MLKSREELTIERLIPKVLEDEDSIEVVTYSDLFILVCIGINTVFIAVSAQLSTSNRKRILLWSSIQVPQFLRSFKLSDD